mmetsp:Transcript_6608/g.17193  ORF Transcript_6608/g.17193 Transcript_6608/m.17193 type:complete len:293 (+) Transcript_6608:705-1583(+)
MGQLMGRAALSSSKMPSSSSRCSQRTLRASRRFRRVSRSSFDVSGALTLMCEGSFNGCCKDDDDVVVVDLGCSRRCAHDGVCCCCCSWYSCCPAVAFSSFSSSSNSVVPARRVARAPDAWSEDASAAARNHAGVDVVDWGRRSSSNTSPPPVPPPPPPRAAAAVIPSSKGSDVSYVFERCHSDMETFQLVGRRQRMNQFVFALKKKNPSHFANFRRISYRVGLWNLLWWVSAICRRSVMGNHATTAANSSRSCQVCGHSSPSSTSQEQHDDLTSNAEQLCWCTRARGIQIVQ